MRCLGNFGNEKGCSAGSERPRGKEDCCSSETRGAYAARTKE